MVGTRLGFCWLRRFTRWLHSAYGVLRVPARLNASRVRNGGARFVFQWLRTRPFVGGNWHFFP